MIDYKSILLDCFGSDMAVHLEQPTAVSIQIADKTFSANESIPVQLLWKKILEQILRSGVMQNKVEVVYDESSTSIS